MQRLWVYNLHTSGLRSSTTARVPPSDLSIFVGARRIVISQRGFPSNEVLPEKWMRDWAITYGVRIKITREKLCTP